MEGELKNGGGLESVQYSPQSSQCDAERGKNALRTPVLGGSKLIQINKGLVPIPPLNEQKRIVAKVDQLMALCDELEAGLIQAQTEGGKLMEAVVHHVLAA